MHLLTSVAAHTFPDVRLDVLRAVDRLVELGECRFQGDARRLVLPRGGRTLRERVPGVRVVKRRLRASRLLTSDEQHRFMPGYLQVEMHVYS